MREIMEILIFCLLRTYDQQENTQMEKYTYHTFCLTLSCLDIIQKPQEPQTCPIVRRMLHRLRSSNAIFKV